LDIGAGKVYPEGAAEFQSNIFSENFGHEIVFSEERSEEFKRELK